MADTIESVMLDKIYTEVKTKYPSVVFGTPDITTDSLYVWISSNVSKDTYYYDNNFELFMVYIYVSSTDYVTTMEAAHEVRNLFHKKVFTLSTGFTNLHTYCASKDIIYEQEVESKIRTIRIIPVNARAVKN